MGYEARWLVENKVMLQKYIGTLDTDSMMGMSEKSLSMLTSAQHKIHAVADFTELKGIHPQFTRVPMLIKDSRAFMSHPNLGAIIGFGTDNKLIKFVGAMVTQIGKNEWRYFVTKEEAVKYLMHNYSDLRPDLQQLLDNPELWADTSEKMIS